MERDKRIGYVPFEQEPLGCLDEMVFIVDLSPEAIKQKLQDLGCPDLRESDDGK